MDIKRKKRPTKKRPTKKRPTKKRPTKKIEETSHGIFQGFFFEMKLPCPEQPTRHDTYTVYAGVAERDNRTDRYGESRGHEVSFSPDTVFLKTESDTGDHRFTRDGLRALCERIIECLDKTAP